VNLHEATLEQGRKYIDQMGGPEARDIAKLFMEYLRSNLIFAFVQGVEDGMKNASFPYKTSSLNTTSETHQKLLDEIERRALALSHNELAASFVGLASVFTYKECWSIAHAICLEFLRHDGIDFTDLRSSKGGR